MNKRFITAFALAAAIYANAQQGDGGISSDMLFPVISTSAGI